MKSKTVLLATLGLATTLPSAIAIDYTWITDGTIPNILDSGNWLGGIVPPNDGTNINLASGNRILFQTGTGNKNIPDNGGRMINVASGAQIVSNGSNDVRVFARVNMSGTGVDGNGAFHSNAGGWSMPQNVVLNGATSLNTTNNESRIDGGRWDLAGNTITLGGPNGTVFMGGTNILGTAGSRINSNAFIAMESRTIADPNVTVALAANTTHSSWDGANNRREHQTVLANNAALETRKGDRDLTFTGGITVAAGDTGVLRAQVQGVSQPGDGTDMRLNIMGSTTGAGAIRQDANGTLLLSGNNAHTGGTILNGAASSSVLAASNTAFGTGTVTVQTASTVNISNAGGLETRDSATYSDPVAPGGTVNAPLTGLHSTQAFDNTRFSYVGKIQNATSGPVVYTFAEQYDDEVFLEVNGTPVLNDIAWGTATNGQITLAPGEHDIRVSVRNGGGGAGPNSGWDKGVGISTAFAPGGATLNSADYLELGDAFEVYQGVNRTIANNFAVNNPLALTTTQMNGYDATLTGVLSGPSSLTVTGSAHTTDELILSGANTYAGDTTVGTGAAVVLAGSHTNAANYLVTSGTSLKVTGALNVTDLASPSSPADLAITNNGVASMSSTGSINLDLWFNVAGAPGAAGENDEVIIGGTASITLDGNLTVSNTAALTFALGNTFDLFDWNTAPTGTFSSVTLPSLTGPLTWDSSQLYSAGTITVVPEPAALSLVALFGVSAALRRRRR